MSKKWAARKVARLPRRFAESTRPKGRWVSYARRHALPVCGSDNPRRLQLFTLYARFRARASTAAPGKTERIVATAARIVAVAAATPQERAAAAVPALRRGADNEQWCCCQRGLQLYQLRAAWGATGQLSGIWLGLWVSASRGAAQSASMFIYWWMDTDYLTMVSTGRTDILKKRVPSPGLAFSRGR